MRRRRRVAVLGLSLIGLLACVALIAATGRGAAGALASSLEPPSARAEIGDFLISYDADIDRSGRLVVVGLSHPEGGDPESRKTVVIRHLRNGALDTSFGGNGVATLQQPIIGAAVAAGPRRIAVAGPGVDEDLLVARFNLDGSRDRSFGQNGIARPYQRVGGAVPDIAVQSDSRILVGGVGALLRLTPDGALDRSFGEEGFLTDIDPSRLALQPDGKIVAVGPAPSYLGPPDPGPQVIRLNRDGTLDPTFGGGDGLAPFPGRGQGLALQADGKIVVSGAGASACLGCLELVLARYTSGGQPDPGFGGGDGLVTASGVGGGPLALQGERIVVQHITNAADFEIARYTPEGVRDPTFGVEGIVRRTRTSLRQPLILVGSLAVQPSGRLLAVGDAHVGFTQQDAAVQIAFQSSGERDRHFGGGDGIVFTPGLVRCRDRFAQIVGSTSADVIADNPRHNAVIAGLGGSDQINAGDGDDLVCGGSGDDEIGGESGNDRVLGERGQDLITGGLDDDQLLGGSGMDRLLGGPGIDRLFGGQGDDFLRGGPGRDRLRGGAGNDEERP